MPLVTFFSVLELPEKNRKGLQMSLYVCMYVEVVFSCGNCALLWRTKCNITNGNVTNDDLLVFFKNEKSEYKVLSA